MFGTPINYLIAKFCVTETHEEDSGTLLKREKAEEFKSKVLDNQWELDVTNPRAFYYLDEFVLKPMLIRDYHYRKKQIYKLKGIFEKNAAMYQHSEDHHEHHDHDSSDEDQNDHHGHGNSHGHHHGKGGHHGHEGHQEFTHSSHHHSKGHHNDTDKNHHHHSHKDNAPLDLSLDVHRHSGGVELQDQGQSSQSDDQTLKKIGMVAHKLF